MDELPCMNTTANNTTTQVYLSIVRYSKLRG